MKSDTGPNFNNTPESNRTRTVVPPAEWAFAAGAFVLAFALRLPAATQLELTNDEAFTLYWSSASWERFWAMLPTENNPPLHFLLSRLLLAIGGPDPVVLRLPSLLFSAATAGLAVYVGYHHFGWWAGVLVGLVLLGSNFAALLAIENRGYALMGFLALLAPVLLERCRAHPRAWGRWLLLAVVLLLLVYTHYMGFFVGLGLGLGVLITERRRAVWWGLLACLSLVLVLYSPYVKILLGRAGALASGSTYLEAPAGLESLYNLIWRFCNQPAGAVLALALLAVSLAGLVRQAPPRLVVWLLALFATGWILVWVVSYWIPLYHDRYLYFAQAPFVLVLGAALASPYRKLAAVLGLGLAVLAVSSFRPPTRPDFYRQAGQALVRMRPTSELLIVTPGWEVWPLAANGLPGGLVPADSLAQRLQKLRIVGIDHFHQPNQALFVRDYTADRELCFDSLVANEAVVWYWPIHAVGLPGAHLPAATLARYFPVRDSVNEPALPGLIRYSRPATPQGNSPVDLLVKTRAHPKTPHLQSKPNAQPQTKTT